MTSGTASDGWRHIDEILPERRPEDEGPTTQEEADFEFFMRPLKLIRDAEPGDSAVAFLPSGENVLVLATQRGIMCRRHATKKEVVTFLGPIDEVA